MRRLNKRGMDDKLMFVIWEVVVFLMVALVLIISVKGIANNTTYWKKYHSADLALMTDLIIAGQGEFTINYDMKDIRHNWFAKTFRIDPLEFLILLRDDAIFAYEPSIEKDRFPQSFIFAKDKNIKINRANTTYDYVILYTREHNLGISKGEVADMIICPSKNTHANIREKDFDAIALSDESGKHLQYINTVLNSAGLGSEKDLLVTITHTDTDPTTIYYNPDPTLIASKKMACLLKKQLSQKLPNTLISYRQYDGSLDIEPFRTQKNLYFSWIIIKYNTKEFDTDTVEEYIGRSLQEAITEYYE